MPGKISPNLWFNGNAEEAAEFYCSVLRSSKVLSVSHYPEGAPGPFPAGSVMTVEFELDGERFVGINGGPEFIFSEAVSFEITCADQAEVDYFWEKLADGGEESQCGWLKDRFGVSWQVVPTALYDLFNDQDPQRSQRAMQAMISMKKLDIEQMLRAADGDEL